MEDLIKRMEEKECLHLRRAAGLRRLVGGRLQQRRRAAGHRRHVLPRRTIGAHAPAGLNIILYVGHADLARLKTKL